MMNNQCCIDFQLPELLSISVLPLMSSIWQDLLGVYEEGDKDKFSEIVSHS